jgi:hypothetical protein
MRPQSGYDAERRAQHLVSQGSRDDGEPIREIARSYNVHNSTIGTRSTKELRCSLYLLRCQAVGDRGYCPPCIEIEAAMSSPKPHHHRVTTAARQNRAIQAGCSAVTDQFARFRAEIARKLALCTDPDERTRLQTTLERTDRETEIMQRIAAKFVPTRTK